MPTARKIIDSLYEGELDTMKSGFNTAIVEKLAVALEERKREIAKSLVKESVGSSADKHKLTKLTPSPLTEAAAPPSKAGHYLVDRRTGAHFSGPWGIKKHAMNDLKEYDTEARSNTEVRYWSGNHWTKN